MAAKTTINCASCGKPKEVRVVDVNRGWGKYCSKSCKATKQAATKAKHDRNRARNRRYRRPLDKRITHDRFGDPKLCNCGDVADRFVQNGFGDHGWDGQCERCADDTHPFDSDNFNNE